ncbi:MAG: hypothetical protein ABF917_15030, partial [Gluconobacter oxydans]|uniref:hypothetical protein n=1 Tax=Gluconobacter oxydans TaxID=442 RepID=UPI0039E79190
APLHHALAQLFIPRWRFILLQYNYQYAQHRQAHERKLLADGNNGDGIREYVGLATRTCPVLEIFIAPCMSRMRRKQPVCSVPAEATEGIRFLSGLEDDIPFAPQKVDHRPVTRPDV